jgi:DNA helicase-2/ATP-dependent DNA helicase PcrA
MKLTPEQRNAVRCNENVLLTACPGSGKTRTIISKLASAVGDVRDTARRVACITYTNAAVYEVESRLQRHIQPGDDGYFDICTIHSFCLNYIFRPFAHFLDEYRDGFKILTPETDDYRRQFMSACERFNRHNLTYRDFEEFSQVRRDINGDPAGHVLQSGTITPDMASTFWEQIRRGGYVDFANIIYYSFVLLDTRHEVSRYIGSKFAWILVDEFQDTTDLQVEILTRIFSYGKTRFFLVGDAYQSVYGFVGARPELADTFATRINARTHFQLSRNFRSTDPIIQHANRIFPRTPAMRAGTDRNGRFPPPVWKEGNTTFHVITDHFLPLVEALDIKLGDAAILAPT